MPDPFHVRFDIQVPIEEARRRFINRIENGVLKLIQTIDLDSRSSGSKNPLDSLMIDIEWALGDPHPTYVGSPGVFIEVWRERIDSDFARCLRAVEQLHEIISARYPDGSNVVTRIITESLVQAEIDIGVSWQNGFFSKKGAELLDKNLIDTSLHWLADAKLRNVLVPFQKGLAHLLEGTKDQQRYGDAITDMYEALEAMAKIVTGKARDLSALREEFISKLKLTESHKRMLKEYIDYGCDFRHALEAGQKRAWPLEHEAETFVYLTGLFVRLAIQAEKTGS